MYNAIFLSSYGSSVYTTLGALKRIERIVKKTVVWNCMGNSSLILFFKCLGYSYDQILEYIDDFELVVSMYNYSSLLIENDENKLKYIQSWLFKHIKSNDYLDKDSTLQDVYSKTGFFPCFIIWDSKSKDIITLNPKEHSNFKFIDCVLSTLCGIGTFKFFKLNGMIVKNLFAINPCPLEYAFNLEEPPLTYLYIVNKSQLVNTDLQSLGPLIDIENSLIEEQFDRFCNIKIHEENVLVLYSKLIRKYSIEDLHYLYEFGMKLCETYLEGRSTFDTYQTEIKNIEDQE